MAYLCEAFDEATNICLQWTEYTPSFQSLQTSRLARYGHGSL
jgi:hypothetical protein